MINKFSCPQWMALLTHLVEHWTTNIKAKGLNPVEELGNTLKKVWSKMKVIEKQSQKKK